MKSVGANTFVENGEYFIEGRTLYKESFINGFKQKNKVSAFTKDTFDGVISDLLKGIFAAMTHYQKGVLMVVESPTEGVSSQVINAEKAEEIIERFNYENRNSDRYATAWGRV